MVAVIIIVFCHHMSIPLISTGWCYPVSVSRRLFDSGTDQKGLYTCSHDCNSMRKFTAKCVVDNSGNLLLLTTFTAVVTLFGVVHANQKTSVEVGSSKSVYSFIYPNTT